MFQACIWEESNCVTELPAEGHFPSPGLGLVRTTKRIVKCCICTPASVKIRKMISKTGIHAGFHCAAHASEFHALEGVVTWNCCDPPYHPANQYSWRKEDPWQKED